MTENNVIQIRELIKTASERLVDNSDSPQLDAEILLTWVMQKPRSYLHTWPEKEISEETLEHFLALLERREAGEPIAHITGEREFWSLKLKVTKDTLIPRPETELLVELALDHIPENKAMEILDLGTGSGAIALAIAIERPACQVTAVEQSKAALEVARENATTHHVQNIRFLQGNWFEPVAQNQYDLIVSNPPYIEENDPHLAQGDVRHEPESALTSGPEGMRDIYLIVHHARKHLGDGGLILVEHGYNQAEKVRKVFEEHGFTKIKTHQDLAGNNRVTSALLSSS